MAYKKIHNPFTGNFDYTLDGDLILFKESVANEASLPSSGNTTNDARFANDTGNLYVWDGSAWQNQGDIIDYEWAAISNKPTSSVVNIDDAVTKKHTQNSDTTLTTSGGELLNEASTGGEPTSYYYDYRVGQTFKPSLSGDLSKITFWFEKSTGDFTCEIFAVDASHFPTGAALATQTVLNASLPSGGAADWDLEFDTPATLEAGTEYAFVLTTATNTAYYYQTNQYVGGYYVYCVDATLDWIASASDTVYFKTYITTTAGSVLDNGIIKQDIAIDEGKTIDGRDISVDGVALDTVVGLQHTQGTDTTLGSMTANVNMNTHKLTGLSVPSSNGDSIRATTKITEVNLESVVDNEHVAVTVASLPLTLSTQEITFNYDSDDFALDGNNLSIKEDGIKDVHIDWGTGAGQVNSDDIPDHNGHSVLDTFNHILNRGKSSAITVTLTGGLGISWTSGEIYDEANNLFVATDSGSGSLTDNVVNYLKWVSGTALTISTSTSSGDEILVATFCIYDGVINCYRETSLMNESVADTRRALRVIFPTRVISGLDVTEDTDVTNPLDVVMSAGEYYKAGIQQYTPAQIYSRNTSLVRHFHTAGVWDYDTNAEIDTTNYDNGTDKTAIPANKWVKAYFLLCCDKIGWVYPTAYFTTKADALDAALPTSPPGLEPCPKLTAIVYQQADANFTNTTWQDIRAGISEESFNLVTEHNDLSGLDTGDYQHLTSAEHDELTQWLDDVTLGASGSLTLPTGQNFIIGSTQWNSGDSIDADSIVDGSTNAAITLTQETNFETAYSHSQNNTQAHSDYLLNNANDETSGILTAGGFAVGTNLKTQYRDAAIYISSIDDGHLDLTADINIDLNSDVYVSGDLYTVVDTDYFASSTINGWAASPTGYICYKKIGKTVFVRYSITGTSNSINCNFTVPHISTSVAGIALGLAVDNGGTAVAGKITISASNTVIYLSSTVGASTGAWTGSGTKTVSGQFFYETT